MKRYFTHQQAEQLLPFLKQVMARLVTMRLELERLVGEHRGDRVLDLPEKLQGPAANLIERIHMELHAVEETGIMVKGLEAGLIDFWARRAGREILLCWQLGEEGVGHWHEVDSDFSGRQPLIPGEGFPERELN
jgi:hypothetical protein